MVDLSAEYEVEWLNKAKEEVKKAKVAVDRRSLYERLKKSVNLNSSESEIEFPNCNLQTLAFEQLHQKLLKNDNYILAKRLINIPAIYNGEHFMFNEK